MYYIYHIPGVKIGCTKNLVERVKYSQKFKTYEILEEHENIELASIRERELQQEYGYAIDSKSYIEVSHMHTYRTQEGIEKSIKALTTRPTTDEMRRKISEANSGENHAMWGKKHKPETLAKMSAKSRGHRRTVGEKNGKFGKRTGIRYIELTTSYIGTQTDMKNYFGIRAEGVSGYAKQDRPISKGKFKGLHFRVYAQ